MNEEPPTQNSNSGDISRSAQTMWILGAILGCFLVALYVMTRVPATSEYADCQRWYGWDVECNANVAIGHLNRGYQL